MKLHQYVEYYAARGDCTCGKCIDAPEKPAQPGGFHTADVFFFKVAAKPSANAAAMRELVKAEFPHWLDGREHSYLETAGDIGDQGMALTAMGLGAVLGLWSLLTPRMLPIPEDLRAQMAGMGMVTIQAPPPGVAT
jgi:hypothetical protein